jgi:predicted dehydrogenase
MPTILISEDGETKAPRSTRTEEVTSYQESFKEELAHFHECVVSGRQPVTSGRDAIHDIALCEAVIGVHRTRTPLDKPSEPAVAAGRKGTA